MPFSLLLWNVRHTTSLGDGFLCASLIWKFYCTFWVLVSPPLTSHTVFFRLLWHGGGGIWLCGTMSVRSVSVDFFPGYWSGNLFACFNHLHCVVSCPWCHSCLPSSYWIGFQWALLGLKPQEVSVVCVKVLPYSYQQRFYHISFYFEVFCSIILILYSV